MDPLQIQYQFKLPKGNVEVFDISLNVETLNYIDKQDVSLPEWTQLKFHQCSHCPLKSESEEHCPLASTIAKVVKKFDTILSYEDLELEVITKERNISQKTTAQRGLASLIGLLFATSGCPYTEFLKPMARFHLPLASEEETVYRAVSMYLLAQYFLQPEKINFNLAGLKKIYADLELVNQGILERLRAISQADSSINGLILLDVYAKAMPHVIDESLDEIRYIFSSYLQFQDVEH